MFTNPVRLAAAARPRRPKRREQTRAGLALVSPTVVIVLAIVVLPAAWTIILAFKDLPLIAIRRTNLLAGPYTLDNFTALLRSPQLWQSLITTLVYSVFGTALSVGLGLAAALLVWRPYRGRAALRAAMLIPYVAPVVGSALVWQVILNPQFGIANALGHNLLGWNHPIPFLSQRTGYLQVPGLTLPVPTALIVVTCFEAWRSFPFAFLFLIARLQSLPADYDEAARIDGATPLQRFRHIVLPQLSTTMALLAVLRFMWTFNRFEEIYLLTGGGAGTEVASVRVYDTLTTQNDVGGSAALTIVMGALLTLTLLIYLAHARRQARRLA